MQYACRGHQACQIGHLRDRSGDYERETPVQGHEDGPDDFPTSGGEVRHAEEGDEHVVVDDLEPDVGVEQRRDTARHELDGIDGGVPAVGGEALVGRVDGVLALVGIDEETEEEVEGVDEGFGADEGLPKVKGPCHFGEEFDEEDRAAEAVYGGHDASYGDGEGEARPDSCGCGDGFVGRYAEGCVRSLGGGGEDARVGDYAHYGEDAEGVEPDGEVGNPGEASEGADLAACHACGGGRS